MRRQMPELSPANSGYTPTVLQPPKNLNVARQDEILVAPSPIFNKPLPPLSS